MRGLNAFYRQVAEEFTQRLVTEFDGAIEAVVLYGSVARKRAKRDSDIDILVISKDRSADHGIGAIAHDIDHNNGYQTLIVPVVLLPSEVAAAAAMGSYFVANVIDEGVVLYDDGTIDALRATAPGAR